MPPTSTFMKLQLSLDKRGEMRFDTAYDAAEGARLATKWAKQGWKVRVQKVTRKGLPVQMTCEPLERKGKMTARCTIKPGFKKAMKPKRSKRRP